MKFSASVIYFAQSLLFRTRSESPFRRANVIARSTTETATRHDSTTLRRCEQSFATIERNRSKTKERTTRLARFSTANERSVAVRGITPKVEIIRRKLHGDFRARLPIRLAFHDFANPRLGLEERPRDRRPNDYPSVSDDSKRRNVHQPMPTLSRKTVFARGFPRNRRFRGGERWPKIGGARPAGTKGGC